VDHRVDHPSRRDAAHHRPPRPIRIYPSPAGGACITVGDLTTFRRALVEVRPLGPELTAAMLIPYARAEGYLPQGYGWSSGSTA